MKELIKYIEQLKADARAAELDANRLGYSVIENYWAGQQSMANIILAKIKKGDIK